MEESENVIATVPSQASVADGADHVGVAGQLIGVVCVTHVIVGGVLSNTTIERLQVAVFPQSSVAVQVLVAVYVPGQEPGVEESEKVTVTEASHASVAVGAENTGALGQFTGVVCATHVMVGGVLSNTTIVALQVFVFPQSSVAVQVLVTLKTIGQVPGVVASLKVTVTEPSQASDTVGGTKVGVSVQATGDV